MIQVENLTKTINNQMILEDISIDIEKGKLTSLIGLMVRVRVLYFQRYVG